MAALLLGGQLFAGGIVSNTNQSAQYVRMLSRNASYEIDAVYFNPAGVAMLSDGFHFSFSNQSIFQTKTVTTDFPFSSASYKGNSSTDFVGDVSAPLFPSFFAAYKKDKIGISFGFGPNGGGGSATYEDGLPSFAMLAEGGNVLPGLLTASGIPTDSYDADIYFDGSSIYWGAQLNFTYEINEQFSVAAGVRVISAKNVYQGHLKTMINPNLSAHPLGAYLPQYAGGMVSAPEFFTNMSATLTGVSTSAYGAATSVQGLIDAGIPDLETALAGGAIDQAQYDQLTGGLGGNYSEGMSIAIVQGAYKTAGDAAASQIPLMNGSALATADVEVDATQTGMAFTPIFSAQYAPNDKLNIAVKYEMNTGLELTNDTKVDGSGMFTNDSSFMADIPAILAVGVGYKISDKFRTQLSFTTYFDKQADWGGKEDLVDKNMWSASLGLEYDITDKFTGSAGFSRGVTGVGDKYQTDISYSNSSNTVGLGIQFRPMENLAIDLGGLLVMYDDFSVDTPAYNSIYAKSTSMVAVGISYNF